MKKAKEYHERKAGAHASKIELSRLSSRGCSWNVKNERHTNRQLEIVNPIKYPPEKVKSVRLGLICSDYQQIKHNLYFLYKISFLCSDLLLLQLKASNNKT